MPIVHHHLLGHQELFNLAYADPEVEQIQYVAMGLHLRAVHRQPARCRRQLQDEGAATLERLRQSSGLQTRNRLPHDRPADPELTTKELPVGNFCPGVISPLRIRPFNRSTNSRASPRQCRDRAH